MSDSRQRRIRVVFYHRKPQSQFSVEEYFSTVRTRLPRDINAQVAESSRFSRGVWPRIAIALEARARQGDVNHITGDINYVAFALTRKRTILTMLDCGFEIRPPGWRRELLKRVWYSWPQRAVVRLTAISEFTKQRLVTLLGCDPSRIDVIPVCLSTGFGPQPLPDVRSRPVILQIGTKVNKNIERLAQAMRGLNCELRVVGRLNEGQRRELRENSVNYSEVSDLTRGQIVAEYARATVVSFVSTYEGFGMPILEGQAVGRPVLTSSVASMPEVAGGAGWLVDPYDVEAIRTGLLKLLTEEGLRLRLVELGFRNVARFRPEVVAAQYAELYRRVARSVPLRV